MIFSWVSFNKYSCPLYGLGKTYSPILAPSGFKPKTMTHDHVCIVSGPFLMALLLKLEGMVQNSLPVNLMLTGLISRLAVYSQPLLRSFLLNHNLVFQPTVKSLVQVCFSPTLFLCSFEKNDKIVIYWFWKCEVNSLGLFQDVKSKVKNLFYLFDLILSLRIIFLSTHDYINNSLRGCYLGINIEATIA